MVQNDKQHQVCSHGVEHTKPANGERILPIVGHESIDSIKAWGEGGGMREEIGIIAPKNDPLPAQHPPSSFIPHPSYFPRFSLLHATRGRPQQCLATRDEWLSAADHPEFIEHVFAVDDDDTEVIEAIRGKDEVRRMKDENGISDTKNDPLPAQRPHSSFIPHPSSLLILVPQNGERRGVVPAWNAAALASTGSLLFPIDDDTHPPRGWDTLVWNAAEKFVVDGQPRVFRFSVQHQTDSRVFPFALTRTRYTQQGWLYYPEYRSMYADTDFWAQAKWDSVIEDVPALMIEHRHYLADASVEQDATYRAENDPQWYGHGLTLYRKRNLNIPHGKTRIMLATPIYLNDVCVQWMDSFFDLLKTGVGAGMSITPQRSMGDTVNRQRNTLMANFMAGNYDYLLQVDSDMGYSAEDVIRWIRADLPLIGANYPQRRYDWKNLTRTQPRSVPEFIDALLVGTAIGMPGGRVVRGFHESIFVGGGMTLTRRDVPEAIARKGLVEKLSVWTGDLMPGALEHLYRYYQFKVSADGGDRGEDYVFCDLVRAAGFDVWCDRDAITSHAGPCIFSGRPAWRVASDWKG